MRNSTPVTQSYIIELTYLLDSRYVVSFLAIIKAKIILIVFSETMPRKRLSHNAWSWRVSPFFQHCSLKDKLSSSNFPFKCLSRDFTQFQQKYSKSLFTALISQSLKSYILRSRNRRIIIIQLLAY